jgi:uncharacterized protein YndB with AHSA1/START domain
MATMRHVRRSRVLGADRPRAWCALTDPGAAAAWLGAHGALDLRTPGSCGTLTEPDGTARQVVVETVEPGRRLVLRWCGDRGHAVAPSRVEVALADAEGGGTRVTVTEVALADAQVGAAP